MTRSCWAVHKLRSCRSASQRRNRGFTLIELLVVAALLVVVVTVAIPGFQAVIDSNRVTTYSNAFSSALNLARSEAIRRGGTASLEAEPGGFENGWCVYVGNACNEDGDNEIIRRFDGAQVNAAAPNGLVVTFDGRGRRVTPALGAYQVDFSPLNCAAGRPDVRQVFVNLVGQVRTDRGECS